jgi:hypothetical protein
MAKIEKKIKLPTFELTVWFRYGDEKDLEVYTITANSLEEAVKQAENKHNYIIGTYHNGQKVNTNKVA